MVYFFASAASAFLCWRAINKGAITGGGSVLQNGVVEEGSPGLRTTEVNEGSGQPVPLALRMLQLVTWNIACLVSLVVVSLFWVADVSQELSEMVYCSRLRSLRFHVRPGHFEAHSCVALSGLSVFPHMFWRVVTS